jgi:putative glycosyltransferase (TIGR04372 family)
MSIAIFSKDKIQLMCHAVWAVPGVFIIRLMRPIRCIRICEIRSERIGHFVQDICEHIGRNYEKNNYYLDLYYFVKVSNTQWEKMARRSKLIIVPSLIQYLDRWNKKIPGGRFHLLPSSNTESRDTDGLFSKFDCSIPFLLSEKLECKSWLETKGWCEGEPFVIFLVRDAAYQSEFLPNSRDWDYHNYRNSDIKTYLPAMKWLADQGVWVLRMGKTMNNRITLVHDKIIDYAFDQNKSDLLDIWLFSNCNAIVTTSSGLDILGAVYKIPILQINFLPLHHLFSFSAGMILPKKLLWREKKSYLSISEMLNNGFLKSDEYLNSGIKIIDLTEQEILECIKNFWNVFNDEIKLEDSHKDLNEKFWKILENNRNYMLINKWRHPNSYVSNAIMNTIGEDLLR